jgi:hypothetical protein
MRMTSEKQDKERAMPGALETATVVSLEQAVRMCAGDPGACTMSALREVRFAEYGRASTDRE